MDSERRQEREADKALLDQYRDRLFNELEQVINGLSGKFGNLVDIVEETVKSQDYYQKALQKTYGLQAQYLTQQEQELFNSRELIKLQSRLLQISKQRKNEYRKIKASLGVSEVLETGQGVKLQKIIENLGNDVTEKFINAINEKGPKKELLGGKDIDTKNIGEVIADILTTKKGEGKLIENFEGLRKELSGMLSGKILDEEIAKNDEISKIFENQLDKLSEKEESLEKIVDLQDMHKNILKDILGSYTGMNSKVQTLGQQYVYLVAKGKNFKDISEATGKFLEQNLSKEKIFVNLVQKGEELIGATINRQISYRDSNVEMMKAISQTRTEFGDEIDSVVVSMRELNVTSRETLDATRMLFQNFREFSKISATDRESYIKLTSVLERIGVNSDVSSRFMSSLNKALGQNQNQIEKNTKEITNFSRALGVNAGKTLQEFTSNLSYFLRYGNNSIETFKKLSVVANKTGIEINELIGISKGFDTFEDAASKAGQLNAILGGPFLNTLELINETDPSKRIQMIADAIKRSGKDINQYYLSDAIGSMVGGNGVETLNRIMNQNLNNINEQTRALDNQGKSFQSLEEIAKNGNVTLEQYKTTVMESITGVGHLTDETNSLAKTLFGLSPILPVISVGLQGIAAAANIAALGNLKMAGSLMTILKIGGILGGLGLITISVIDGDEGIGSILTGAAGGLLTGGLVGGIPGAVLGAIAGGIAGSFAEGTDNGKGGLSLVGERGPEMIVLPKGANVINNKNIERLSEIYKNNSTNSSLNSSTVSNSVMSSTNMSSKQVNLNISLMIDDEVFAKHTKKVVLDTMEENFNIVFKT